MRNSIILSALLVTLFLSCGQVDDEVIIDKSTLIQEVLTRSSQLETYLVDHSISYSQAEKIIINRFPDKVVKSIVVVTDSGEDVMYVANFDVGWAIVTGDDRLDNTILAYDDEGSFDPKNIDNQGVRIWYEIEKERLLQLRKLKDERDFPVSTRSMNEYEPYYWLGFRIDTDYSSTSGSVDHLLDTEWGQGDPWNTRCPYYSVDDQCPAGCLAVATGQILYYLQVHKGFSIGLYHTVTPTFTLLPPDAGHSTPYFVFSNMVYGDYNEPSSRWASMPKTQYGSNASYVADLLIDIGYRFGLSYSPYGSGCVYIAPVFNTFNIDSFSCAFYFPVVKDALDDGYPVMVDAYQNPDYTNGHAWVIDGYLLSQVITDKSYRWYMASSDSLSYYSGYEFCYTEAQKQQYAPDANEEEIYHIIDTTGGNYLRMNWGYNGSGDNGLYSMNDYHWPVGNNISFKYHPFITYGFSQEEEPEYN